MRQSSKLSVLKVIFMLWDFSLIVRVWISFTITRMYIPLITFHISVLHFLVIHNTYVMILFLFYSFRQTRSRRVESNRSTLLTTTQNTLFRFFFSFLFKSGLGLK